MKKQNSFESDVLTYVDPSVASAEQADGLLKGVQRNRPTGLVQLHLARGDSKDDIRYYIRYPVKGGPQPLLGVSRVERDFDFGGKETLTPKAVVDFLRRDGQPLLTAPKSRPKSVQWSVPQFHDALTVLPKSYTVSSNALVQDDQVLLAAFAIVAAHYERKVEVLANDPTFLAGIPATTKEPPYRNREAMKMFGVAAELLRPSEQGSGLSRQARKLAAHAMRLRTWNLWNIETNSAVGAQKWSKQWKILTSWERWQDFGMSWRECAAEMDGVHGILGPGEYTDAENAFMRYCSRWGLRR